ncbi:MAG TPA: tetratricopeptide repeat protein [Spirochaetota bacterium]|nr:tetratricopeptide repeat protein [Spirochaetota bacterium]HOD15945.1 tetratricopeptide repeat protein [Spirochaetota bacterium]HPG51325.1 tetratricopeptide repeat protein [Spirochaetota bacterium]HPN11345.1 tetratricopeptide repeat protein [Spirochaetota bacterium]HQL82163.1 tetratricopeptide repeat protein [Spirochaetota bacterium]
MTSVRIMTLLLALALLPAAVHAAEDASSPRSLDALADDVKFQNGLGFIKLKMYDKALETFNEYLEIYYNGNHRNEAYKYIAEIYFNRLEYARAIQYYRALYEEFSNTEPGVEAFFNTGICYMKMGYDKEASEVFNEIIENHRESAFRQQAELQLDMLNILGE